MVGLPRLAATSAVTTRPSITLPEPAADEPAADQGAGRAADTL
jgi:hypothetical protein